MAAAPSIPQYLTAGRDGETFAPLHNADCFGQTVKMARGGGVLRVTFPNKDVGVDTPKSSASLGPAFQWAVVDKDGKHDLVNVGRTSAGVLLGSKLRQGDKKFCGQRKQAPDGKNEFLAKLRIDGDLTEHTLAFTFADRFVKEMKDRPRTTGAPLQTMRQKLMPAGSSDEDSDMFGGSDVDGASFMGDSDSEGGGINLAETSDEEESSEEADSEDERFNTPHPKDARKLAKSNGAMSGLLEDRSCAKVQAISKYQSRPDPQAKAPKAPKSSSGTKRARPDDVHVPAAARPRTQAAKERAPKAAKIAAAPSADSTFLERVSGYVQSVRDGVDAGNSGARALWEVIEKPTEEAFEKSVLFPILCNLKHHGMLRDPVPASPATPPFKAPWM